MAASSSDKHQVQDLNTRYALAHLRLTVRNVRRLPWAYLPIELTLLWLFYRAEMLPAALVVLAFILALQVIRQKLLHRVEMEEFVRPSFRLNQLTALMITLGILRASLLPILFSTGQIGANHYLVTLVYMGFIGGSIGPSGGVLRTFVGWCATGGAGIVLAWVFQGTVEGLVFGFLLTTMMIHLGVYVADQGAALRETVRLNYRNEVLTESLRSERDKADEANRSKSRFFAAANHDLRQPPHALSINVAALEAISRRLNDDRINEVRDGMKNALDLSQSLLEALLDVSNLDANRIEPRWTDIDMNRFMNELTASFRIIAQQKGLYIHTDLCAASPRIRTDPDLLERIVSNVLGNAIKFTASGGVRISTIQSAEKTQRSAIRVEDTGPGIAPEEQERIFEEFYQIENRSRDRRQGLGLGLAIVRRIAGLVDAEIKLDSTLQEGTCVTIWLPNATRYENVEQLPASATRSRHPSRLLSRILVIDDELTILDATARALEAFGCSVRQASDRREALRQLNREEVWQPELVMIDYRLKEETGLALAEHLKEQLPALTRVVIISGETEREVRQKVRTAGYELILKPLRSDQLLTLIDAEAERL